MENYFHAAEIVSNILQTDVIERDSENIVPFEQIKLLKDYDLLNLVYENINDETFWSSILKIVQKIAESDTAIAHLLGYHYLTSSQVFWRSTPEQMEHLVKIKDSHPFWGNASNPKFETLFGVQQGDSFKLNGFKTFSTGSQVANYLLISWIDNNNPTKMYNGVVPVTRNGLKVNKDWNGFGQKQTGSGTVEFDNVFVYPIEILKDDINHLSSLISQTILLNIYTGASKNALNVAKGYYSNSNSNDNDLLLKKAGYLFSKVHSLKIIVDNANYSVNELWNTKEKISEEKRGNIAISILNSSVQSIETSMEIINKIFELMGARSATLENGYDRLWRNIRTLTLHSPIDHKYVHLGKYYLINKVPTPGFYS
ncbi:hypothetical protein [Bacillus sp. JJ722]|uniref:hypothetical protein n=1 Tax=Bacillus sp. JJ722 TaxID=3122973 RepID=UPI002FFDA452